MTEKEPAKKGLGGLLPGDGRVSVRSRNFNIALFALIASIMFAAMFTAFYKIIWQVATYYSGSYATSSAEALSAHITREISIMAKSAHSSAVVDWMADEDNDEKKVLAFKELSGVMGGLYSSNLYVGLERSLNEYKVEEDYEADGISPFTRLDENNPEDLWYFECVTLDDDYKLSIAIDHVLEKKRVWLDYKIVHNGVPLGVISTGLDFSHVAGELFSQYGSGRRGFIIDSSGIVYMESLMLGNDDLLNYDFEARIEEEITDPLFLEAVRSHLGSIEGYFEVRGNPTVIKLSHGPYRIAAIAPIRLTDWSAVVLYDPSSSLNISLFLPALVTALILLVVFALSNNIISRRLIFQPLELLVVSLERLKENKDERIYGLDRDDEFGKLSNTIRDLFTKANNDALTGLYNRRFMENELQRSVEYLSRSNGLLSVLMLDIDYFKKYNDTYGHEEGDVCLKMVATALSVCITRKNDFVARYGGEEFLAALPNTDEDGARLIAQKLLESVRMMNLPHAGSDAAPFVTVSIGVTTGKVAYLQTWEDYSKQADKALYMSKQNGRNQYTYLDMTGLG